MLRNVQDCFALENGLDYSKRVSLIIRLLIFSITTSFTLFMTSSLIAAQDLIEQHAGLPDWNTPAKTISRDTLDGGVFIEGEVIIPESREQVWEVLTDYDKLTEFIPNMLGSATISDSGDIRIIYQKGKSKFFLFSKTVEIYLRLEQYRPGLIKFELRDGPFHYYRGSWTLTDRDVDGTLLTYRAVVKPDFFSPKFITKRVMKNELRASLEAIRAETKRRNQK